MPSLSWTYLQSRTFLWRYRKLIWTGRVTSYVKREGLNKFRASLAQNRVTLVTVILKSYAQFTKCTKRYNHLLIYDVAQPYRKVQRTGCSRPPSIGSLLLSTVMPHKATVETQNKRRLRILSNGSNKGLFHKSPIGRFPEQFKFLMKVPKVIW